MIGKDSRYFRRSLISPADSHKAEQHLHTWILVRALHCIALHSTAPFCIILHLGRIFLPEPELHATLASLGSDLDPSIRATRGLSAAEQEIS